MSSRRSATNAELESLHESFVLRSLVLARPSTPLTAVSLALTLQAKNLYNTAHFAVNNVRTAYERDDAGAWTLKAELHEHQSLALARFNAAIDRLNDQRTAACERKRAEGGEVAEKAKLTLLPRFESTVGSLYRSLIDITVLDNVLREWPGQDGSAVYRRLPAKAAQLVLHRYRNAWTGYFEALEEFTAGNAAMTGRPRPPDYLARRDRFVVELPLTQLGQCLIGLGERQVPVNFEETISLTQEELSAWAGYRISDAVAHACARRGFPAGAKPQHLRIVPHKGGVKFEAVVRVPRTLPEDSLLAQFELHHDLPDNVTARDKALVAALRNADPKLSRLRAAGIDFGVSNTAALAFTTGHRAQVVSGGRLDKVLGRLDAELDALQSSLMPERAKALQRKQDEQELLGQRLSRAESIELRKLLKEVFADSRYRELRGRRERWLNDYAHKLTRGLVELLAKNQIQALVLGQNKGWKDGAEMGRRQNRRFGRIPHARLVELLRYKAEALGIVVVTTEESYTSKTSFVANEPLKTHSSATTIEAGQSAAASTPPILAAPPRGKRLKHKRHTFVNLNQTGRWGRVHADVNAAFNIVRKVFLGFAFHAKLDLAWRILRVSPRLGLVEARLL